MPSRSIISRFCHTRYLAHCGTLSSATISTLGARTAEAGRVLGRWYTDTESASPSRAPARRKREFTRRAAVPEIRRATATLFQNAVLQPPSAANAKARRIRPARAGDTGAPPISRASTRKGALSCQKVEPYKLRNALSLRAAQPSSEAARSAFNRALSSRVRASSVSIATRFASCPFASRSRASSGSGAVPAAPDRGSLAERPGSQSGII